ncbi:PEP-CTERM protein-sorting domain-containing protein [Rubritalea squalenifaciens DSM 18772]|uniref:PEP-CTERM protein-sorting domain-containing protein n=1 Tax=Rubritalea squalenifaciens DSM 18772 TaxID=1123071 RepID=A0A1M6LJR7_9BACT|nr:PEP-CTERM sorting domain-containing protein [Rubritalea squalenifaciens]SHJ71388.1 PEP-CTERM protein-sorting domain-containing protein [Rubritalea squalenifaciens DSM 18772]
MADRVRLTVTDNFAAELVGGDRVGLSEFRFVAVPEPSSVSLLGLAGGVPAFPQAPLDQK